MKSGGGGGQVLEQWELPKDLEKIWMIDSKELHVALDDKGQPVMLGKGAYGAVRSHTQIFMLLKTSIPPPPPPGAGPQDPSPRGF